MVNLKIFYIFFFIKKKTTSQNNFETFLVFKVLLYLEYDHPSRQ